MKYLICGNYGVGNVGDECIALGIQNLIKSKDPQAEFLIMGKGKLLPIGVRSFIKSLILWGLWVRPFKMIRSADRVIIGGGGLFTDEERALTGLFWAMHGLFASIVLRKPIMLLGVSCGPMGRLSTFLTKILFKRAQHIYCRDSYSVTFAKELSARSAELCPDMAAYFDSVSHKIDDNQKSGNKVIYFILRDYKNITGNMIKNFVRLVNRLHAKFAYNITFLSFNNDSKMNDNLVNKIIAQNDVKNSFSVQRISKDLSDLTSTLKKAHFIFSMRYHGGLLSLTQKIPFISINYMSKSSNFWRSMKDIHTVDLADFSLPHFSPSSFDELIESPRYRATIESYSTDYMRFADQFKRDFSL